MRNKQDASITRLTPLPTILSFQTASSRQPPRRRRCSRHVGVFTVIRP